MSRDTALTRTALGQYTLTVGDAAMALDANELTALVRQALDLGAEMNFMLRLTKAMFIAEMDIRDIIETLPDWAEVFELTTADLDTLADLQTRLARPVGIQTCHGK